MRQPEGASPSVLVPKRRGREGTHISEGTDRVSFDLFREFPQHVNLTLVGAALDHAIHHLLEVSGSLSAGSALSATELRSSPRQYLHDVEAVMRLLTTRACRTEGGWVSVRVREYGRGRLVLTLANRAMAATMSVDLFMTMTAPVPSPDCRSLRESKSILRDEMSTGPRARSLDPLTRPRSTGPGSVLGRSVLWKTSNRSGRTGQPEGEISLVP